ncbi:MAG: ABC transporter substrate-binding protein [Gammaproteobacteria bacterium WSBS_2016_MAG_OTU1]
MKKEAMDKFLADCNGLSRREFMRRAALLGVAVPMASGLYGSALAATPQKGGVFRYGLAGGSTTDTLDPGGITDFFMQSFSASIRGELTEIDHKNDVIPQIAESWEGSDQAKTWRFKIRRGVEFHNGRTLTPDDVVASMNHHRGEDSKSASKPYFAGVTDISIDGDYVVFKLNSGSADFPFLLHDYHIPICSANADGTMDWQSGIGSGAYVMKSFEPGVRAEATRFANYWKPGRAHFDGIQWLGIADVTARTNALVTGEIDAMNRCDLKTVNLLERNPNLHILNITGTQHYTAPMITTNAPFDNNDVRLALKYAVDREELVKKVLHGYGLPGNDHPVAPANRYFDKGLEQRKFDPDKARYHAKKAGLSDLTVQLSAADAAYEGAVDAAVLWSENAKKCGINIEVVREPSDGYWSNVWLKKNWSMCFWSGRPTEDLMFTVAYSEGAAWNDSYWSHTRFNKLLVEARAELDDSIRREMYSEMQRIVRDEGGVPNMMYANYVSANNNKVANDGKIATNWDGDGFKGTERWWFNE